MFLVTDGNAALQSRKIVSLELDRWFSESNIGITNKFGSGYAKPSANIINKIELLNNDILPEQVVFFGDRSCDLEFSKNAGFCFIHVNNMINIDKSL